MYSTPAVREIRESLGWTQQQTTQQLNTRLAKRNISREAYAAYERGTRSVPDDVQVALSALFKSYPDQLFKAKELVA